MKIKHYYSVSKCQLWSQKMGKSSVGIVGKIVLMDLISGFAGGFTF